ncbi:hypothetical protein DB346_23165 [Verrucomicrobia bacterium LW23]|nr:hypothetical protein DB346_23165 [Verrucomicrobia bacterium LW23]
MASLERLLGYGFLPRELPPCFKSHSFGQFGLQAPNTFPDYKKGTKPGSYDLVRAGHLRRKLDLLNPISYFRLATFVSQNWSALERQTQRSRFSKSSPIVSTRRAIERATSLSELPYLKLSLASQAPIIFTTDIAKFYSSIYTHAIPWAMHTKATAKQYRFPTQLLGNHLDLLIRNCQDEQTIGIPTGPDISLLVSEILLSAIDEELAQIGNIKGIRYVDDYFFACRNMQEADLIENKLFNIFRHYQLDVNSLKTQKLTPDFAKKLNTDWVNALNLIRFSGNARRQKIELVSSFEKAFSFRDSYPGENVLKFLCGRMRYLTIDTANRTILEDLLIRSAFIEPGVLPFVLASLVRDPTRINEVGTKVHPCLTYLIESNSPRGHSSEVAWSLWGHIIFGLHLDANCCSLLVEMQDPVCLLMALYLRSIGKVATPTVFDTLNSFITQENLRGPHWLMTYEASVKGWLRNTAGVDVISLDPDFAALRQHGVSFLDVNVLHYIFSTSRASRNTSQGDEETDSDYSQSDFWDYEPVDDDHEDSELDDE